METLRVLSRGHRLVLDLVYAKQTNSRRYLGRTAVQSFKLDELPKGEPRHEAHNAYLARDEAPMPHYAFPKNDAVVEIPAPPHEFGKEYLDEIKAGNLWPADEATAAFCGVKFDPQFGGDHPQLVAPKTASKKSE